MTFEPYITKSEVFSQQVINIVHETVCTWQLNSFANQLKAVALAVIRNSFCGSLPELQFCETQPLQNRHVSNLMAHIVTVVLANQDQQLLQPFVCMILKTSTLKVSAPFAAISNYF